MESDQKLSLAQRREEYDRIVDDETLLNDDSSDLGYKANGSVEGDTRIEELDKLVFHKVGENGSTLIQTTFPPTDLKFEKGISCRSARNLKTCYENLKRKTRKICADNKVMMNATGGGTFKPTVSKTTEKVMALIQSSITPLTFAHDSDALYQGHVNEAPVSIATKKKIAEIQACLSEKPVNKSKLISLAKSEGGFINDDLRKLAWPKLLGVDAAMATPAPSQEDLEAHVEYQQVVMDVNRSLKRFPPGIPYDQRVALQDQLTRLILRVIIKYPHLRYYQGYHDVAVTFLLVVGEDDAFQIMEKLSIEHLKDCMEPTMDKTSYLLNFIYPLIRRLNPALYEYLEKADVGTMFCLAWFLTWYGHSLNQYHDVVRLYDYFLASPPLMPLYLAATLVVHRQDEIFAVECDMACVHDLLSKIPDDLPFEMLLKQADSLYQKYPPESIEREVRERFEKELQMRRAGPPRRTTSHHWWRFVPRIRYRVLIVTATLVGIYAYFRMAEAVTIDGILPVR